MTDQTSSPTPFADPQAEKSLLCACMLTPECLADATSTMQAMDFHLEAHKAIFAALSDFRADGRHIDLVVLSSHMANVGTLDIAGGSSYLASVYTLLDFGTSSYTHYKQIIQAKAKARHLIAACDEIKAECMSQTEDVTALLEASSQRLAELCKQREIATRSFKDSVNDYMDVFEARMRGEIELGIPTRWPSLNAAYGGLTPRMWLVAAYPSDGKTTLAQNMAEDVLAAGRDVLWFSYEMDVTEHLDRLAVAISQVEGRKIFNPSMFTPNRDDMRRLTQAIGELQSMPLHLRCEPTWTIEQIVAETRSIKAKHPRLGLVIVDYLQLVPTSKEFKNRSEQVAYISRTFKRDVSAANNVAGLMLSQLNDDGRTLDSRAPNQDASNALFIEPRTETMEKGKTIVKGGGIRAVKNRNGKRGDLLPISLNGHAFQFTERKIEQ